MIVKYNFIVNRTTKLLVLSMFLMALPVSASSRLCYQVEHFSPWVHRMMGDHGRNVLYNIFINDVEDYLPCKFFIKGKLVKRINKRRMSGKIMLKIVHHRFLALDSMYHHEAPIDFFASLREGPPHTFVIMYDRLIFTESTGIPIHEKYKDIFSKHYFISKLANSVHYAGEMFVYKNYDAHEIFVVVDNASGTFKPASEILPELQRLLDDKFSDPDMGLYFLVKTFEQRVDKEKLFAHEPHPFY